MILVQCERNTLEISASADLEPREGKAQMAKRWLNNRKEEGRQGMDTGHSLEKKAPAILGVDPTYPRGQLFFSPRSSDTYMKSFRDDHEMLHRGMTHVV